MISKLITNNKMSRQRNNSLWWQGVFGRLKMMFGGFCFVTGFVTGLIWSLAQSFEWGVATIGLFGVGIYSIVKGSQQEFHSERESGYIVYQR